MTIVITNYNYAAFVTEAVQSALDQSYKPTQIIVVDDVSTDGSQSILQAIHAEHGHVELILNEVNVGQSGAMLAGLARANGEYIVFLDADDALTEHAVATHIKAHLSLRVPVGFTSGDMVQVRDGRIANCASPHFYTFFRENRAAYDDIIRPVDRAITDSDPDFDDTDMRSDVCYVAPNKSDTWPWSPTSANCFRRDALKLLCSNPKLPDLKSCTDCYLLHGISALTGSALVNVPLAFYRLHGRNDFVQGANLNRIRPYNMVYLQQKSDQAMTMLIDYLLDRAEAFDASFESAGYYEETLDTLDRVWPPIYGQGPSYLDRQIVKRLDALKSAIGKARVESWLVRRCPWASVQAYNNRAKWRRPYFEQVVLPRLQRDIRLSEALEASRSGGR